MAIFDITPVNSNSFFIKVESLRSAWPPSGPFMNSDSFKFTALLL